MTGKTVVDGERAAETGEADESRAHLWSALKDDNGDWNVKKGAEFVQVAGQAKELFNKVVDGNSSDVLKDQESIQKTLSTVVSVGSALATAASFIGGGEAAAGAALGSEALMAGAAATGPIGLAVAGAVGVAGALVGWFCSQDSVTNTQLSDQIKDVQQGIISQLGESTKLLQNQISQGFQQSEERTKEAIIQSTQEIIQAFTTGDRKTFIADLEKAVTDTLDILINLQTDFTIEFLPRNRPLVEVSEDKKLIQVFSREGDSPSKALNEWINHMNLKSELDKVRSTLHFLSKNADHDHFVNNNKWLRSVFIGICEQWQQLANVIHSFLGASCIVDPNKDRDLSSWTRYFARCGFLADSDINEWFLVNGDNVQKVAQNFDFYGPRVEFLLRHNQIDLNKCADENGKTLVDWLVETTCERKQQIQQFQNAQKRKQKDETVKLVELNGLALAAAASGDSHELAQLIGSGVKPMKVTNPNGETLLHLAARAKSGAIATTTFLLNRYPDLLTIEAPGTGKLALDVNLESLHVLDPSMFHRKFSSCCYDYLHDYARGDLGQIWYYWSPKTHDKHQWMEIDCGQIQPIFGVVTAGGNRRYNAWVKSFRVEYRKKANDEWTPIVDRQEQTVDFYGNEEAHKFKYNLFSRRNTSRGRQGQVVMARYIRILPQTWDSEIAMRAGVLVLKDDQPKLSESYTHKSELERVHC